MLAEIKDVDAAPGPRGLARALGNPLAIQRDVLGFLTRIGTRYGDIARMRMGPFRICLLNSPELIRDALVQGHPHVAKYHREREVLAQIEGMGLLASEGEHWQSRRQLLNPVFQGANVDRGTVIAARRAEAWCDRVGAGNRIDVVREMTDLAMGVMMQSFFGPGIDDKIDEMRPLVRDLSSAFISEIRWNMIPPAWIPIRHNRRKRAAIAGLDALVERIVAQELGSDSGSLISLLLQEVDKGNPTFTARDARDEVVTMFNSGHDTTAAGLAWTWYLLGRHPDAMRQMHDEARRVVGAGTVLPEHVSQLTYTRAVIQESMRIYPPGWALFGRITQEAITVGSWRIPRGYWIMVYPWVTHRDARFFEDPLEFDPQRFLTGRRMHKRAYFPFGIGPHACIGAALAMNQTIVIMATIAKRFGCGLVDPTAEAVPEPLLSIWPRGGLPGQLVPRS